MSGWLRKRIGHDPDLGAAEEALAQAETAKADVQERWQIVDRLTRELRLARQENNYAARLRAAFGEGR